jgi:hypothetical protein
VELDAVLDEPDPDEELDEPDEPDPDELGANVVSSDAATLATVPSHGAFMQPASSKSVSVFIRSFNAELRVSYVAWAIYPSASCVLRSSSWLCTCDKTDATDDVSTVATTSSLETKSPAFASTLVTLTPYGRSISCVSSATDPVPLTVVVISPVDAVACAIELPVFVVADARTAKTIISTAAMTTTTAPTSKNGHLFFTNACACKCAAITPPKIS